MVTSKVIKEINDIKNFDGTTMVNRSKYTVRGALAGVAVGFVLSMYFKSRKLIGMALGGMIGTYLGNVYGEFQNKKNTENA